MALTAAKEQFAAEVSRRTGLQLPTVVAWVAIENGPDDNPLNIARWDAQGRRYFAGFGSTREAVERTVRLLENERYAPILRVARDPRKSIRDELWAIIESPWEETNYTLNGVRGARLIGTYARLYPAQATRGTRADASPVDVVDGTPVGLRLPRIGVPGWIPQPDDPGDLVPDVPLPDVEGWVGALTSWLGEKAALAFLYVVLTLAAGALIVSGLLRVTGTSAGAVGSSVGARLRPAPDDIPF